MEGLELVDATFARPGSRSANIRWRSSAKR
jgi:hypothetical protein